MRSSYPPVQVAVAVFVSLLTAPGLVSTQEPPSTALDQLTAARKAMGGTSQLASVKTLRIRGYQKAIANNLRENRVMASEPLPLEYRIALPDRFFYSHSGPRGLTPPSDGGFIGNTPLIEGADVRSARRMMGLLVFPLLLNTDSAYRLRLQAVDRNTLRFEDPDGNPFLVELDATTSLPKRIHYIQRNYREGTDSKQIRDIGDYRQVGNLLLPHRLTAGDEKVRELGVGLYFESIEVNPPLTPTDFRRK